MLQIDFINVGYGDAVLVRETADEYRFTMLIDAGDTAAKSGADVPGSPRVSAAAFLKNEGVTEIDVLVMSHIHRDHIGGFAEVLKSTHVKKAYVNYLPDSNRLKKRAAVQPDYEKWQRGMCTSLNMHVEAIEAMSAQGTEVIAVDRPSRGILLSRKLYADIDCAHPETVALCRKTMDGLLDGKPNADDMTALRKKVNLLSLRFRLYYGTRTIVFPADAYGWVWEDEQVERCDILKMPHHGCCQSMSEKLMQKLRPSYTVVPVSNDREDNRPAADIMAIVHRYCENVMYTDAVRMLDVNEPAHASVCITIHDDGTIDVKR